MQRWLLGALALALTLPLTGCSGDEGGGSPIPGGTASGKVGGQAWALASGTTDSFLSDANQIWVNLYAAAASCDMEPAGNSLIVLAPRKPGEYTLGGEASATFVVQAGDTTDNLLADGRMRVDEVTATSIKGGLAIQFDISNSVQGDFSASICP
jgi:hypothetical protein